jgi:FlaA1/EpsC-like NDP-sugar epimerase
MRWLSHTRPVPQGAAVQGAIPAVFLRYRRLLILGIHLLLIPAAYLAAFLLRFDFALNPEYAGIFWRTLPYILILRLTAFAWFGLFQGWWRYVGMRDLIDLIQAVTLSSGLFVAALFLTGELAGLPRSVLVLDWVGAIFLFGGIRFCVRGIREGAPRRGRAGGGRPTLILGAGSSAELLLRQLRRNPTSAEIDPVGLVDDDPVKRGMRLHGVPVLGSIRMLDDLVSRLQVQLLVIAIPSATREQMQEVINRCLRTGIEFKIVPSMLELLDGRARVSELRSVEVEDLLGRDAVSLDLRTVKEDLEGKVVLITGGAGSIGAELVRQVAAYAPARLILVDQAESPLYFVHLEVAKSHPQLQVFPIVADVTDEGRIEQILAHHQPEYVFHAAAYKHVPLMESNAVEAVRNNVLGTLYMAQSAARYGVKKFVLISTDKAVHPSSVMGATKRVSERIVLGWPSLRGSGTDFRAVRFGNVLGSQGSVVPLFKRQIAAGGPITITDPEVTRYFMTIPEAVQLVLQAAALPEAAGRISMLDMGEPVRILDLAENLLRLSGLQPHRDISIVYTGMRPGEKLHEELMSALEATIPTSVEKIHVVQTDEVDGWTLVRGLDRLGAAVALGDGDDLLLALCALVPECSSPLREAVLRGGDSIQEPLQLYNGRRDGPPVRVREK